MNISAQTNNVTSLYVLYDQLHYDNVAHEISIAYSKLYAYFVETNQIEFNLIDYANMSILDEKQYRLHIIGRSESCQFLYFYHNEISHYEFVSIDHKYRLIVYNDSTKPPVEFR